MFWQNNCAHCRLLHFYNVLDAKWWNQDKWLQVVETRLQKTNWVYLVHHISTLQMFAWLAGPAETIQKGLFVKLTCRWNLLRSLVYPPLKNISSPSSFSRICDHDVTGAFAFIFLWGSSVSWKTLMKNNLMRERSSSPHNLRRQMLKCRYESGLTYILRNKTPQEYLDSNHTFPQWEQLMSENGLSEFEKIQGDSMENLYEEGSYRL